MTLQSLLVHDVTILTAAASTSRYGDSEPDWATAASAAVKGWISQRSTSEDTDHRTAEISDWILYLDTGTTITAANRVTWSGITFEVAGPVNPAWSPRGEHHLEVPLRVVDG